MPVIVVNLVFNPPEVSLIGKGLSTSIMNRLESELIVRTTTSRPVTASMGTEGPLFVQNPNGCSAGAEVWRLTIPNHYCDDLAKCAFFGSVISVMEGDGWSLVCSSATTTSGDGKEISRFFFSRRA
ncbi:hypothetical protein, unlikely [Trypanosoma brucei gambiense DAL972]|uniref:Uncharacterized protein n=1 Tax=Trypanosoma brucei gambiense (strain MHOM/CI/86/DAL972) TaxID=679716 RepID=C9ZJ38_TRYB9|nr:hypothetical protein, unlikely [Trypanosoma brucei gambiense DAL972]CBH09396.1 hypothetical protein, unlikely [Trypanosoma brucei gambiense DAL972]|eukprot:XP_011771702.1 hypothetical protein, unlikely [Trypanosoma brucei gambiense DAL972]